MICDRKVLVDEKALVNEAKEGKESALEELYMRNKEKIAAVVYYYVGNRQDAEDLLQEIFIKAFLSIKKFNPRPGASFSSWLYRIGINISISFLKKRQKQDIIKHDPYRQAGNALKNKPVQTNPEQAALQQEIRQGFHTALSCLSPQQKMIFVLKHFQGLKVPEISRYIGRSQGSVRKQLFRAVLKMREKLGFFYEGVKP